MSHIHDETVVDLLHQPRPELVLKLSDELTIYGAATLQARLQGLLSSGDDIVLDLADVCELDCAGVQLLLLLQRECQALHRRLRVSALSAAAREVLDLLNLPRLIAAATSA